MLVAVAASTWTSASAVRHAYSRTLILAAEYPHYRISNTLLMCLYFSRKLPAQQTRDLHHSCSSSQGNSVPVTVLNSSSPCRTEPNSAASVEEQLGFVSFHWCATVLASVVDLIKTQTGTGRNGFLNWMKKAALERLARWLAVTNAQRDFLYKQSSPARADVLMPPIGNQTVSYNQ